MDKTRFLFVLCLTLVIIFLSCKKSEKPESIEIPAEEVQITGEEVEPKSSIPLLFTLDGRADDWTGIEPLWKEAGISAAVPVESGIDIKQVYFKNDAQYLYVFMRLSPTIEERFKKSPTGGILANLFLDTDNNPQTGSNATELFKTERYQGYDIRVYLPIGVWSVAGQSSPYVGYEIYTHEGGFYGINVVDRQNSMDEGALIAHGPDGVEFALRLEAMKLAIPTEVRVMLVEHSHFDEEEGHSLGKLSLNVSD